MSVRRSMVPILTECCDEPCQTVRMSGIWRIEPQGLIEFASTPSLGLIFTNGESFLFNYSVYLEQITIDGGTFSSDTLRCFFEGDVVNGTWNASVDRVSGSTYLPAPPDPPDDGSIYELSVSWCPECGQSVTCEITFNDVPWQSFTLEEACLPRWDNECNVEVTCSPLTIPLNPMSTVLGLTVTLTDLGGGQYQLVIDDPNASGLWTDPAFTTTYTGIYPRLNGAAFNCSSCDPFIVSYPYEEWRLVDPGDGNAPYTLPIAASSVANAIYAISGSGVQTTIDFDFNLYVPGDCADLDALIAQAQALLDAWVTQFGSGNPVAVLNASATSVDCYGYSTVTLPTETMDVAYAGVNIDQWCSDTQPEPPNVTGFVMECGALAESPNIIPWIFTPNT